MKEDPLDRNIGISLQGKEGQDQDGKGQIVEMVQTKPILSGTSGQQMLLIRL